MRRLFFAGFLAVAFAGSVSADVTVGVDFGLDASKPSTGTAVNGFNVSPSVGIGIMGDRMSVEPAIMFAHQSIKNYVNDSLATKESYNSFGLSGGLFFAPIDGDVFTLSLGPDLGYAWGFPPSGDIKYSHWYDGTLTIAAPIRFDLHLNKTVALRISDDLASFTLNSTVQQVDGTDIKDKNTYPAFHLASAWTSLSLGLRFTF